jgi:hypothetical protein
MQILKIDQSQQIPLIYAIAEGPMGKRRLKLVFDTGCGTTQIDTALLENLGYSASDGLERVIVTGPAGDPHEGYTLRLSGLSVFDSPFTEPIVAAYDFDRFSRYGIQGLLGWDVIKQLHLELDGPAGLLKVF